MLDRRDFLKTGALGGAVAVTANACTRPATEDADAPAGPPSFELEEWTAAQLTQAMEAGELTAEQVTTLYLERIEAVDAPDGIGLSSLLEVNPDAVEIAAGLDRERAAGNLRGPLHGIPVVLKDNIDTGDKMLTTAGSLALVAAPAPRDAWIVDRLRAAGAVVLAKANLSEWANFRSSRSSSGWSGRGGQTRNPYALDRNPCGSSSGSGAAVSANLCTLAVGTETDGSVVCPSNANGVVGVKPTVGLLSRTGIIPISASQDTAGPMCRTVADAALLLGAMTGVDPADPASGESASHAQTDYLQFLAAGADGLAGARIGVWRERFGFHERVDAILEDAIAAIRDAGAEIVDPVEMPSIGEIGRSEYEVLLYEFKDGMEKYLADRRPDVEHRNLEDLIRFNEENADREMPYFRQETFEAAVEKGPLTEAEYLEALEKCRRLSRDEGLDRVLAGHRLDAIVGPTGGPAWVTDLINGDRFGGGSSRAAAVSGYANVTVPAGMVFGLPVGISFIGGAWSEPVLLRLAHAFEQVTQARRAPGFLATADLSVLP